MNLSPAPDFCSTPIRKATSIVFLLFLFSFSGASSRSASGQDAIFTEELQKVDATQSFVYILDADYGENEWSVAGFAIRGGSIAALEHGAGEALYQMGFRFYAPKHRYYPDSLNPVTLPKQEFAMPFNLVWLSYGHDRRFDTRYDLEQDLVSWQKLNNVFDQRRPGGHIWDHIINQAMKDVYDSRPDLLRGERTFELDDPAAYAENVQICADFFTTPGVLNDSLRRNFDPADSDLYPSETIYRFALDVVTKVRETIPNAELGVYAYAGHRLPVEFDLPGIYIQVALGFNNTHLTYDQLVQQHGQVADAIMLREYLDVETWWLSAPLRNERNKSHYYQENYPGYLASGAVGVNGEFNANWLVNMPAINHGIRFMKTGAGSYQETLDEIVTHVFDGDPAVAGLYEFWSDRDHPFNRYTLRDSFDWVSQMQPSPYRTHFEQYLVIIDAIDRLGAKTDAGYADRLEAVLRQIHALTSQDIIHSYALQRRLANGNVVNDFPDLWMFRDPLPDWILQPQAPSHEEFVARHQTLVQQTGRPAYLDDEDLVLADVTPTHPSQSTATAYTTRGAARFKFLGPGTVDHDFGEGNISSQTYGSGLHSLAIQSNATTTWTEGRLFLDMFSQVWKDPSFQGDHWLYVPNDVAGQAQITSTSRITIFDQSGRLDIVPGTDSSNVGPGQVMVHDVNTRGNHSAGNVNRYLSPYPNLMLMPRELAVRDQLTHQQVSVVHQDLGDLLLRIDGIREQLESLRHDIVEGQHSDAFPDLALFANDAVLEAIEQAHARYAHVERASVLDSKDWVVADVTPVRPAGAPATAFTTRDVASFVFVGPGTVTHEFVDGSSQTRTYGADTFTFTIDRNARTTWTDGRLFLNMFPEAYVTPSYQGDHWLYVPQSVAGRVELFSSIRWTVFDQNGRLDILPGTDTSSVGPGQIFVHDVNITGRHSAGNVNRFLSPYPDKMLMPKELAESEGLTYRDVTSEGWSSQELVLEHLMDTINSLARHWNATQSYQFK